MMVVERCERKKKMRQDRSSDCGEVKGRFRFDLLRIEVKY